MKRKNQKGAISLFALLSVMFFITFMIGVYGIVSAKNNNQSTSLQYIQKQYYKDDATLNSWYNAKK